MNLYYSDYCVIIVLTHRERLVFMVDKREIPFEALILLPSTLKRQRKETRSFMRKMKPFHFIFIREVISFPTYIVGHVYGGEKYHRFRQIVQHDNDV